MERIIYYSAAHGRRTWPPHVIGFSQSHRERFVENMLMFTSSKISETEGGDLNRFPQGG